MELKEKLVKEKQTSKSFNFQMIGIFFFFLNGKEKESFYSILIISLTNIF